MREKVLIQLVSTTKKYLSHSTGSDISAFKKTWLYLEITGDIEGGGVDADFERWDDVSSLTAVIIRGWGRGVLGFEFKLWRNRIFKTLIQMVKQCASLTFY